LSASSIFRSAAQSLVLLLCSGTVANALDAERAFTQYIRDRWGSESGFPGGPVYAITQTTDGYLWIAGEKGLVRFDGVTFRLLEPAGDTLGFGPTVLGLAADPDGSLWLRLRGPVLMRYRNGSFETVPTSDGHGETVVTAALARPNGVIIAALGQGAKAYRDGRFHVIAPQSRNPTSFIMAIAESPNGDIWLGTRDTGLLRVRGERLMPVTDGVPDPKINCLLAGSSDLWIGTDRGVVRWTEAGVTRAGVPAALRDIGALAMARDRDANVWIAAGARGLIRVDPRGIAAHDERARAFPETVTAVFEDRDGNLWVGTNNGIERWRDPVFTTYSAAQGLPSVIGPVFVDEAGRTWFAPADGGLYWMQNGVTTQVRAGGLDRDVVYSITGDSNEMWVGTQRGGLLRLRVADTGVTATRLTQADGLPQDNIYAVFRARDGAMWAGTLSGGVSRMKDGAFTTYDTLKGLSSNTVTSIAETGDGTMWFATPNGVSALSRGGFRRYSTGTGLPSNEVNTLFEDSTGTLWAGTAGGIAVLKDRQLRQPQTVPAALRQPIFGITEDRSGWLWIATPDRALRVNREAMQYGVLGDADVREFGIADGLISREGVKRHRSVVTDSRGRVWMSFTRGLSVADPARADNRVMPALAHIEGVSADTDELDVRQPVEIPAGRRRVTFAYAGLSLSVPERVMYRYRLDGFDRDWTGPVSERQAVYTNLTPGEYVFRVTASNSDGLWNGSEAALRFAVQPTLWQATAFRLALIGLCAVGVWGAYRIRVHQVARQLGVRFEERLAERTRIAQELHDTLLQGFVSASMQLHVATDQIPDDSPAKSSLERVLGLMGRVIEEGRNAVRGLRLSTGSVDDLRETFSRVPQEFAFPQQAAYRVIVQGQPRPLKPIVRDEVYRIGREALVNAFRHSSASHIELELEYGSKELRMFVRDDGRGVDPEVLRSGTEGHWGIMGMRERAERIGATLRMRSRDGAGTEIDLSVPAHAAFERRKREDRV
jgi:signal transduction histidine kinase